MDIIAIPRGSLLRKNWALGLYTLVAPWRWVMHTISFVISKEEIVLTIYCTAFIKVYKALLLGLWGDKLALFILSICCLTTSASESAPLPPLPLLWRVQHVLLTSIKNAGGGTFLRLLRSRRFFAMMCLLLLTTCDSSSSTICCCCYCFSILLGSSRLSSLLLLLESVLVLV